MIIYVVDTETTGINGTAAGDLVLEIGIVSLDIDTGEIKEVYEASIGYDQSEWSEEMKNTWAYTWEGSTMKLEDNDLQHGKPLPQVIEEVRAILDGEPATAFNREFDFDKFLYPEPWHIQDQEPHAPCIMKCAERYDHFMYNNEEKKDPKWYTEQARAKHDATDDDKWDGKYGTSTNAQRRYCWPSAERMFNRIFGGNRREAHRALSDAVQEAQILRVLIAAGAYSWGPARRRYEVVKENIINYFRQENGLPPIDHTHLDDFWLYEVDEFYKASSLYVKSPTAFAKKYGRKDINAMIGFRKSGKSLAEHYDTYFRH